MIQIALYRGKSFFSRVIMFLNWSEYSHASFLTSRGTEIEAWATGEGNLWKRLTGGKVREVKFGSNHTADTIVDIYDIPALTEEQAARIEERIRTKVGCKYDWPGCFRFITRVKPVLDDRWFCSELIAWAFEQEGFFLTRKSCHKTYPADLAYSTRTSMVQKMRIVAKDLFGQAGNQSPVGV
jgi:uncharacterized protein YycO